MMRTLNVNGLMTVLVALMLASCVTTTSGPGKRVADLDEAALYNVRLGWEYMHAGDLELAREKLQRAIGQDPDLAEAHHAIAMLHTRLDDTELAEKHYRRALRLKPRDPTISNSFGVFLCNQNRHTDAEKQFLTAASNRLYRTPEAALTNAGVCARRQPDDARAEQYFRKALSLRPGFPDALWYMADMSFGQENYLQARAFVQRYLLASRATAEVLWLAVRVERALGDGEAADEFATRLRTEFPESAQAEYLDRGDDGRT